MTLRSLAVFSVWLLALWGCDEPGSSQSCLPNATQACLCPNGDGIQTCREDGKGFTPCQCGEEDVISDTGTDTDPPDTLQPDTSQTDTSTCAETVCGTACVDTDTDLAHCGSCDNACVSGPRSTATCSSGSCSLDCAAGFFDCDLDVSNGCETLFGCDVLTGVGQGDDAALAVSISGDGRYLVFASEASDLVVSDTNNVSDIFLLDRVERSLERISLSPTGAETNGHSFDPVISEDGHYVAFTSYADNIDAFDLNEVSDVFRYRLQTGTVERVSQGVNGTESNGPSSGRPAISANGRFVAFTSEATNIVPNDTNAWSDVFLFDTESGQTEKISEGEGRGSQPALSSDGRMVVFTYEAQGLAERLFGLTAPRVFLHDRQSATTSQVSQAHIRGGEAHSPAISGDGLYIAFLSDADFALGPRPEYDEVYLLNNTTDELERITQGSNNTAANGASSSVSLSRDGRYIAFASDASNLAAFDRNERSDVFLFDQLSGLRRLNINTQGDEADGPSHSPIISSDARFVAFLSSASNLASVDDNGVDDVFVVATGVEAEAGGSLTACITDTFWCAGGGCLDASDLRSDSGHCGACGSRCLDTQTCNGGACACPGGGALCYNTCSTEASCPVSFTHSPVVLGGDPSERIRLADLDGDNDLDAFIINNRSSNHVLFNNGDGTFADSGQRLETPTQYAGSAARYALDMGDVDGDGDVDAFVANSGPKLDQRHQVWLNDGTGTFSAGHESGPRFITVSAVALGDLDLDGDLDVYVANNWSQQGDFAMPNHIYLNNGEGVFSQTSQSLGNGRSSDVSLGDLDGDGDLDAVVVNQVGANRVWLNDGVGGFVSGQSFGNSERGVTLGDVDNDGDLDVFVVPGNQVWLNDGQGVLTDSGQALGSASGNDVSLADVDGDGDLDAFVANRSTAEPNRLWLNDGAGSYTDSGLALGNTNSSEPRLADLDGDGDFDAFVVNNGENSVWLNNSLP